MVYIYHLFGDDLGDGLWHCTTLYTMFLFLWRWIYVIMVSWLPWYCRYGMTYKLYNPWFLLGNCIDRLFWMMAHYGIMAFRWHGIMLVATTMIAIMVFY